MANLGGQYDASHGETMETRDVLPAGDYVAMICKSEIKEAKSNASNRYVNVEFEVNDGDLKGRRFWTMLNLWNSNSQAVEIAQRELNSICQAVNKPRIQDTEELHGIPMVVTLGVRKNDQYGDQNTVKGYKPMNGTMPANNAQATETAPPVKNGNAAPWQ